MLKLTKFSVFQIIAFVLGLIPTAFFILFLIGEGLAELIDGKFNIIPILILMIFTVSGYILAWKYPRKGGMIMLTGGFVMGIYLLISGGFSAWQIAFAYSVPFIIPGVLFLLRQNTTKNSTV